ncbi:MAG: type II secretion system secretin GspD [Magnetococcales bacterium]|nr:type II secretion system secretin GspD [Magnetococcales bacterium]
MSQLIRLKNVDSNTMVATVKPLMHNWGFLAAFQPTNSIIVTDTAATVSKVVELMLAMDLPPDMAERRVIPLTSATASKIEKLVNSAYADFNAQAYKGQPKVQVFSDVVNNTLLLVAPVERVREVEGLIRDLDRRGAQDVGSLHLYYPKNGNAESMAKVLTDLITKSKLGKSEDAPFSLLREVSIVGEKESNTLVVAATPDDYRILLPVIEGLDMRRLQVYVEALIIEVTAQRAVDFGVEWGFANPPREGSRATQGYGGVGFGSLSNPLGVTKGLAMGLMRGGTLVEGKVVPNLAALVRAMASDTDVNILATPNLLTLDNKEAQIIVGQNVPVQTGTTTAQTTTTTIERRDVGLTLKVTPRVMEEGWIRMDIYQEQSSLTDSITIGNNEKAVVTNKRSIQTTATLKSGEMVVLGGLIQENASEQVQQVPCLGGVTGLGELFKNTSRSKGKSNLMVFIRPVIINTYADLLDTTRKKFELIDAQWGRKSSTGSRVLPTLRLDGSLRPLGDDAVPVVERPTGIEESPLGGGEPGSATGMPEVSVPLPADLQDGGVGSSGAIQNSSGTGDSFSGSRGAGLPEVGGSGPVPSSP